MLEYRAILGGWLTTHTYANAYDGADNQLGSGLLYTIDLR